MNDDYGIKPEWKEAWNRERIEDEQGPYFNLRYPWQGKLLADLSAHLLAKLMESEFEHSNHCLIAERKREGVTAYRANFDDADPRHNYDAAAWMEVARRELQK